MYLSLWKLVNVLKIKLKYSLCTATICCFPCRYKVKVSAGPLEYHKVRNSTAHPKVMYTQVIHNDSPEPTKATITKTNTHARTNTWSTEKAIRTGHTLTAAVKTPFLEFGAETTRSVSLSHQSSQSSTETEQFSIQEEITIPPLSSVEVEWVVTDTVQVCFSFLLCRRSGRSSAPVFSEDRSKVRHRKQFLISPICYRATVPINLCK